MLNHITIRNLLRQIYPDMRISKPASTCIINLFEKFEHMTESQIIEQLSGSLQKQAILNKNGYDGVTNYIVGEIIELSGRSAKDCHKLTICEYGIWISIVNDIELLNIFGKPNVPISISSSKCIIRPTKKIYDRIHSNDILLSLEAKCMIRNILMSVVIEYPHDASKSQLRIIASDNFNKIIDTILSLITDKFGRVKIIHFHHLNSIFPNQYIQLHF
jgi:hypothetical protein